MCWRSARMWSQLPGEDSASYALRPAVKAIAASSGGSAPRRSTGALVSLLPGRVAGTFGNPVRSSHLGYCRYSVFRDVTYFTGVILAGGRRRRAVYRPVCGFSRR